MSDYRNPNDPLSGRYDPEGRDYSVGTDPTSFNATWGWIAGAVVLVVILAFVFGARHEPADRTASNEATPPATHMAPAPTASPIRPTPPSLAPMPAPAPAPAPQGNSQQ